MLSQEDTTQSSSPPRPSPPATSGATTTQMSSKFQRKAKFRRESLSQSQSDTEFIPGISKSPSSTSASFKEAAGSSSVAGPPAAETRAATAPLESNGADFNDKSISSLEKSPSEPTEVERSASGNAMDDDQESESANNSKSPSLSPEMVANALVPSPDSLRPTALPKELSEQEDLGAQHVSSSSQESAEEGDSPPPTDISLDTDFMRPFSPEELSQAKTLVLDLLGWGVEPEFLVTSGVSAEALYRIFTDLNLRLPSNLEVSEDVKAVAYSWGPVPGTTYDTDMDWASGVTQPPPFAQPQAVE